MKQSLLVVGQLPPPYHGSNIMARFMLWALNKKGYSVTFVDKSFSQTIDTIGKVTFRKIARVPRLAAEIFLSFVFQRPILCVYFITCGKLPFLVDAFLLSLLRICRVPYVLRFGGKGFQNFLNRRLPRVLLLNRSNQWRIKIVISKIINFEHPGTKF